MKISEAVVVQYNFWVNKYQFELSEMNENGLPKSAVSFASEKLREVATTHLKTVAEFAYYAGESDLAVRIHRSAQELGSDAVVPAPL